MAAPIIAPILRLSDEMLVHIFNFVPFIDRRSLRDVCERFRIIIEDKTFHRYVDLSYCYRNSSSSLKYFLTSASYKNIQVLNINGCYWIPRADLVTIGKLANLKQLHMLHCKVSLKLLLSITKSMSLVGLSWTWVKEEIRGVDECMESALRNSFGRLEELIIHRKMFNRFGGSLTFVLLILSYCTNLQMLEVRHTSCRPLTDQTLDQIQEARADPDLKKLRSLKVEFGSQSESMRIMFNFCMKVLTSSTQGKNWVNLWLPGCGRLLGEAMRLKRFELADLTNAKALFIDGRTNFNAAGVSESCEFKCRKLGIQNTLSEECMEFIAKMFPNVKEIIMQDCRIDSEEEISILSMMSVRWKNITHLNLISCYFPNKRQDVCTALANMKALTHLSIDGCLIATVPIEVVGFKKDNENFLKKRRIGLVLESPDALSVEENAGLGLLTKGCPLLEYLEISGTCCGRICRNGCPSLRDKDLNAIYRWEHLKSLTLKHLPSLKQCVFLIAICKNCPLQTLRLKEVGASGICSYNASLITALHQCTHLLDFTMMQNYINMDSLFTALMECSKLVRIAVVDEVGIRFYDAAMENGLTKMFTRLQNLLVFYLTGTASTQWCRSCQTHLNTKFLAERPPLSIMISNMFGACDNNVVYPDYHLEEMIYF